MYFRCNDVYKKRFTIEEREKAKEKYMQCGGKCPKTVSWSMLAVNQYLKDFLFSILVVMLALPTATKARASEPKAARKKSAFSANARIEKLTIVAMLSKLRKSPLYHATKTVKPKSV
jgi:hypothetical protein